MSLPSYKAAIKEKKDNLNVLQAKAAALKLENTLQKVIDTVANFKVAGETNMKLDTPKMTVTVDKKMTLNMNEG